MQTLEDQHVIRTARLQLRPARADDEDSLFPLFANWEVVRWLTSPPWPYRREDMVSFVALQEQDEPEMRFAIARDGTLIGLVGVRLRRASHLQRGDGPNIGYWLGQPYWGGGYMTEAARGVIARVFATTAHEVIYSGALAGNAASLRVQEKLGFVRDGDTMAYARPLDRAVPHVNTVLRRQAFRAANLEPA
jgi:RimJ/RimL family protein N-acetyltransferase